MSASGSDSAPPDGGGTKGKSLLTKLTTRIGKDNPYDVSKSQVIHAGPKTGEGDSKKPFAIIIIIIIISFSIFVLFCFLHFRHSALVG